MLTSVAAAAALVTSLSSWAMWAPPAAASTPAVVTLGFDDGTVDQFTNGFPILSAHGMHATFFVNTGPDRRRRPGAHDAGPTCTPCSAPGTRSPATRSTTRTSSRFLSPTPSTRSATTGTPCSPRDSRRNPSPTRSDRSTATSEAVVHYCGYNSGRGVAGVSQDRPVRGDHPPADAYATRTPPNPKTATKLSTLESYVLNAEADTQSTDWVQFVFHRVCDKSTGGHCGAYSISPGKLSAFLDFLQAEVSAGRVVVETTAQVIGGPLNPACHWDTGGTGCIPPAP